MKAVILAGGRGTRLAEETAVRPKPMVKIGGKPILWHIMKIYASTYGVQRFYHLLPAIKATSSRSTSRTTSCTTSDVTFDMKTNMTCEVHQNTSCRAMARHSGRYRRKRPLHGGSISRRVAPFIGTKTTPSAMTYGDGVSNVDIGKLVEFHRGQGTLATMTAIQPPSKYGVLGFEGDRIVEFQEKPVGEGGWINGGFFVLEPGVLDYIEDDTTPWEHTPLRRLVSEGQLAAHFHHGFWQSMDTLRDRNVLEALWNEGDPPWRIWQE